MAKLQIELIDNWVLLETIPITPKTNMDLLNRIPKDKMWRANYLHHIIKDPKMSLWEWGDIPFNTISIIYNCIQDLLGEYEAEINLLNKTLKMIEEEKDQEKVEKLIKQRDFLLESIEAKENNKRVFKYSKETIKIITNDKGKTLQEIIYFF